MTTLPSPTLVSDLRLALACLYNLPSDHQQQQARLNLQQAQDYLMFIQSRNNRRKISSLIQRQRDKPNAAQTTPRYDSNSGGDVVTAGSSWLACVDLLSRQSGSGFHATSPERLFAAQSLMHRMMRSPIHQAVDLEMEVSVEGDIVAFLFQQLQQPVPLPQMVERYQHYMYQFHPWLGSVISQYQIQPHYDEDRVKGELVVITLATIMYMTAVDTSRDRNANPILNALGSAMAATAIRLRFTATNIYQEEPQQLQSQDAPPLVDMVTQALSLVYHTAGTSLHLRASSDCLRASLAAIPDICLGAAGGARGRMSIDPKCIQEAVAELKTHGMEQLWEVLQKHSQDMQQHGGHEQIVHENILIICERWARFLPMPHEFIQHTVPLANQYITWTETKHQRSPQEVVQHCGSIRRAALSYVVAIFEGGSWTANQIMTKTLGLSPEQQMNQQPTKKRQSSRSKRRQKEFLDTHATDTMMDQAQRESNHRGAMACHAAVMVWETLTKAFRASLKEGDSSRQDADEIQIEGEGPIGCLAACANACLPHLLRNSSSPSTMFPHSKELFMAISEVFQEMCQSRYRAIRAFSMEPLFSLHSTLIEYMLENEGTGEQSLDPEMQKAVVEHFFKCSMGLASQCGYPADYFHHMGACSDEDVEIERNDVRDVIRTVAVSEGGGSTAFADCSRPPLDITLQILARILTACSEAIQSSQNEGRLFPETAAHCFSALAKPLNQLSRCYQKSGKPQDAPELLRLALRTNSTCLQVVIDAFSSTSLPDLFPLSRVTNLAIASFSPMVSYACNNFALKDDIEEVLQLSMKAAALSIANIPELEGPSELGNQIYDIRGAMRGPGGEDHVGCLAIMRLVCENDILANKLIDATGVDIQYLCELHSQLKRIELSRGKGVDYGNGVTPKSRRILLGAICHLEIVTEGKASCAATLAHLFNLAITALAKVDQGSFNDENAVYQMCENTLDLAAFSPVIIKTLFDGESDNAMTKSECIRTLTACICGGYKRLSMHHEASEADYQWNRLRAAFFSLLRRAASTDLPDILVEVTEAINRTECEAIYKQCQAGPTSFSSLFHDEIVSEENIPSGLFIKVIGDFIACAQRKQGNILSIPNCTLALHKTMNWVLPTITSTCPDPTNFVDPRPTLCESWFLTLNELMKVIQSSRGNENGNQLVQDILVQTCATAITFPFYPSIGKTRDERSISPFMSLEGPQTLAMHDFISAYFQLGRNMLQKLAIELRNRVPIDTEKASVYSTDQGCQSVAIIGAALFRSAQGAMPPWAVESIPTVYASLFIAFNKDLEAYMKMLQLAMELKLAESVSSIGSVQGGQLLSGPLFGGITNRAKQLFLAQALENCEKDDAAAWRRLKVLVKQISGGKKKDTDFRQKPSPTKFEFDRL